MLAEEIRNAATLEDAIELLVEFDALAADRMRRLLIENNHKVRVEVLQEAKDFPGLADVLISMTKTQ